jgi:hypothetical protein
VSRSAPDAGRRTKRRGNRHSWGLRSVDPAGEYTKRFVCSWVRIAKYQRPEHPVLMRDFDGETRTRTGDTTIFSRAVLPLKFGPFAGTFSLSAVVGPVHVFPHFPLVCRGIRQTATPFCLFVGPCRRATPRDALIGRRGRRGRCPARSRGPRSDPGCRASGGGSGRRAGWTGLAGAAGPLDASRLRRLVAVALRVGVLNLRAALAEVGRPECEVRQPRGAPAAEESLHHEKASQ